MNLQKILLLSGVAVGAALSLTPPATAAPHRQQGEQVVGQLQLHKIREGESLIELARKFDLGFNEIADANPGVDPFIPKAGSVVTIPTLWILPEEPLRPALVINLPELRLYFFPNSASGTVRSFPLGVGDEGKATPVGSYRVVEKIRNPSWHVPNSIRRERPELPRVVPPGSDNPIGSHALRLSLKTILIHGTNRPWGIGRRSSHGCLRLYPEDIKELYRLVPKGMRVLILNQPVKGAARGDAVFVEVHRYGKREPTVGQAMQLLADKRLLARTDFRKLIRAVEEKRGVPVDVTLRLTPPLRQSVR